MNNRDEAVHPKGPLRWKHTLAWAGLGVLVVLAILGKSAVMLVSVLGMGVMYQAMRAAPLRKQLLAITLGALVASLLAETVHTLYHRMTPAPGPGGDQGGFFVSAVLVGLINAGGFAGLLLLLSNTHVMQRTLAIIALFCGATALFLGLWILVPALLPVLWLVAVVASEWSLYVGVMALIGVLLGLMAIRQQWTRTGRAAVVCGLLALVPAVYPPLATRPLAAAQEVDLSLTRYLTDPRPALPEVHTRTYAHADGQTLNLDVYLPDALPPATGRPAMVVVHGGSWNGGRRSDFPDWNAWLAGQGFAVFDIAYRLAPQPNWDTATADVQAAVRWVKARADSFNVDPERMALMGRSAGGHLALLAAYTALATDTATVNARVQAVVAFYAPTDLKWGYAHPANPLVIDGPATLRKFTGGTPESIPDVYARASPIRHVQPNVPATLLLHGARDQLVLPENSRRLLKALQQQNATPGRHQALLIPYAQHGFDYHFNGWGSQVTQKVLRQHLNTHLNLAGPGME